ncbi:MAG: efflux RND transporter permease subunit [Planctomycetes bacterium]|nr:efflux RND transporter permease subunit [Planctomycetota bacterium]
MKAIEVTLRNPYLVVVLVLATAVVGIRSMMDIPADLLPQFDTPAVQIVTFYPGMPPEVMEKDIMSRIERWTGQSVGISHQEGKSMLGVSIVKDFFREDISFEMAISQVTSFAMSDLFYLPPGTIPPMIMPFDPTASVPLCLVSVSSPTMTEQELYDVAYYELRNRLQSIQGVIAPAVYGGVLRRILAYVDPIKLAAHGLSPMDIVRTLGEQSVFIPTGNAKIGDIDYQIISNAMTKTVEEMNDLPIFTEGDAVVFLRDVAKIEDSHQIQSNKVRINGSTMAYIPIYRQPGANTLAIVDSIKSKLARINIRLRQMDPKAGDLVLSVVMDQSGTVRASIKWLQVSAALGALIAGLIVLLFLRSLRLTFIVVLAIPLSILAALIGLFYTGDTINSMTLGGLALAIGILVDQSIVVVDNIVRHHKMGKSAMQAALEGTQEVSLPILVSTVTFVIVFFPVVFLSGVPRFLFQPLAITVTFAVIASYLIAIMVIPAFAAKLLKSSPVKENAANGSDGRAIVPTWFDSLFQTVISMRFPVVLGSIGLLIVTGLVVTTMGTELFPPVDSKQFTILVRLSSGTRIEKTERIVAAIEKSIIDEMGEPDSDPEDEKYPDSNLRILISNIGVLMDWPAAYTPNNGPMDAFILVQTKGKSGKPNTFEIVDALRERLNREFPTVDFAFDTGGMMTAALNFGLPSPIQIQIRGSNLEKAQEIASHIREIAVAVPGTTDVRIAQRNDYPQIGIEVDRVKAAQLGITQEEVIKNVVTALNSSIGFNPAFWIAPNFNHYFIGAQYREEDIDSLETLRDIPITGAKSKQPVPLRNVAEFYRTTGPAVINHHNITRVTDIFANVASGYDAGSVAAEIEARLQASTYLGAIQLQDERGTFYDLTGDLEGYSFKLKGETETMRNAFYQFGTGLGIAVILIYLAMVAQLRSFSVPFIIVLSIPLGFIGVIAALKITGTNLNIPAFMGIIMMAGIVVEYSIILLEFANQRVRDGLSVTDAIREATWIRLRPILMTSLTTWLALIPMAIGAAGGEANAPLARAVIGGVLAATVLSLIVIPCMYVMVKRVPKSAEAVV